jgi:hypothetical protein
MSRKTVGHLQVFGEHFDALSARFFTRLLSDYYPIKPRSAEQNFEQKGDLFLKTWLKLQLLLEEIRTRRQQARLRKRSAEWEAHLALQALTGSVALCVIKAKKSDRIR